MAPRPPKTARREYDTPTRSRVLQLRDMNVSPPRIRKLTGVS